MYAKFFKAPTIKNGVFSSFYDDHLFDTDRIVSYSYTKYWTAVGKFEIVLPFNVDFLSLLELNGTIYIDGDWLMIESINYNGSTITITGKDCKGFLETRISLYWNEQQAGTQGYDVVSGSTLVCLKHYLDNNAVNPTDSERQLPLFFATDSVSGISNDHYMARLQPLSEIFQTMCNDADIGYEVVGDISGIGYFVRLLACKDKSFNQSKFPRIIFSAVKNRNVVSQNFENDIDNMYNAIYGTGNGDYTKVVYRDSAVPTGLYRRECSVSVSSDIADSWFEKYTLNEVPDNIESNSFEIAVPDSGYGTEYNIGDIVTVFDDWTGNNYNRKITEVQKSCSQGQREIILTLGQQKSKPMQKIVNNMINKTIKRR